MVVLHYSEKATPDRASFIGVLCGNVVRLVCYWRRNAQAPMQRTALDTVARAARGPEEYRLYRMGAESAKVDGVPLGTGLLAEPIYLVGIPESTLNEWMRATG